MQYALHSNSIPIKDEGKNLHRIKVPKTVSIPVSTTILTAQESKGNDPIYCMKMKSKDPNNLGNSELKHTTNDDQRS